MSEITIRVDEREGLGSNASRRMRREGLIPAVVYGGGKDSVPIHVDRRKVLDLLRSEAGENTVFLLTLGETGKERHAMIHEMQVDPVTGLILHIDFQRIDITEKVKVAVPIEVVGTAVGVKTEGGMVDFITRELSVECLPGDIPNHFEVDVSELHIGQHLEAKDITLPPGVTLLDEEDRVILSVAHSRVAEEEEEEAAEEEELLEQEAEEPEVIGKGKEDEEG